MFDVDARQKGFFTQLYTSLLKEKGSFNKFSILFYAIDEFSTYLWNNVLRFIV